MKWVWGHLIKVFANFAQILTATVLTLRDRAIFQLNSYSTIILFKEVTKPLSFLPFPILCIKHFIYIPRTFPILFLLMFAICIALHSCLPIRIALHQWQILCRVFLPNCTHKPLAQMAVVCFQTAENLMWMSRNRAVKTLLNHTFFLLTPSPAQECLWHAFLPQPATHSGP